MFRPSRSDENQIKNNCRGPIYIRLQERANVCTIKILGHQPKPDHVYGKEYWQCNGVKFYKNIIY